MKRLFLLLFLASTLWGTSYSNALLEMHANILPKIILMDYGYKERLVKGEIVIRILYDDNQKVYGSKLEELLEKAYPGGIRNLKIEAASLAYDDYLAHPQRATMIYLLETDAKRISAAIRAARKEKSLVFAVNPLYLERGAHASLEIGQKVRPYLNISALKEDGISFRAALMRIAKLYHSGYPE